MAVVFFDRGASERIAVEMGMPVSDLAPPVHVYGLSEFERSTIGAGVAAVEGMEHTRDELDVLYAATRVGQVGVSSQVEAA